MKKKISYCVFSYNQENFIKETITSVLSQTYSPIEFIFSDDFSSDDTFNIIKETVEQYKGKNKIVLNRNKENLGLAAHVSKVLYTIASGKFIILLGGDDFVKKNHASFAIKKMLENKEVNLIDFSGTIINSKGGIIKDINLDFSSRLYSLKDFIKLKKINSFAPGRIIRKELVDAFPPISKNCPTEDSVLVLRSLLTSNILRINKSLIYYRKHKSSITSLGIFKLSNHTIVSQYLKDILYYYDKGNINDRQFELILKRIHLELEQRKHIYLDKLNKVQKLYNLLYRKCINLFYKIHIRISFFKVLNSLK